MFLAAVIVGGVVATIVSILKFAIGVIALRDVDSKHRAEVVEALGKAWHGWGPLSLMRGPGSG